MSGPPSRSSLLFRLASPFREFGWLAGSLYLIDRCMRRLSPRLGLYVYELMVQPITGCALLAPNLVRDLSFAEILAGDPTLAQMPAREDIKVLRYWQGAHCLGVWRKGELIGYIWYCFARYEEDEVRCTYRLTPALESVFDFDLYVLPAHRLGIGFMAVWHGANHYLHERGIRYSFSRLTRFNLASRKAHVHLGWKRVGRAVFLQAGSIECMVATVRPWLSISASPTRRVQLLLEPSALTTAPAAITPHGRAAASPDLAAPPSLLHKLPHE